MRNAQSTLRRKKVTRVLYSLFIKFPYVNRLIKNKPKNTIYTENLEQSRTIVTRLQNETVVISKS